MMASLIIKLNANEEADNNISDSLDRSDPSGEVASHTSSEGIELIYQPIKKRKAFHTADLLQEQVEM